MPRFKSRRTSRSRARRYALKMDPDLNAWRIAQQQALMANSWVWTSTHFTNTEDPILARLREAGVPEQRWQYYLASGKEAFDGASSFGDETGDHEVQRTRLERVWRELTPAQVEQIYDRAKELGQGQITLHTAWQATKEVAPKRIWSWSSIPAEIGELKGDELHLTSNALSDLTAYVDMATTDWSITSTVEEITGQAVSG